MFEDERSDTYLKKLVLTEKLPSKVIMTDDNQHARMIVAHHLEYDSLLFEQGDVFVSSGSYKDIPVAVVSTGKGSDKIAACLSEIIDLGATEVFYLKAHGSKNEFHLASQRAFEALCS